jgi:Bacteriophage head to tail connecting protein
MTEQTLAERFKTLDGRRQYRIDLARKCSSLTIPSVLPPRGWTEDAALPQPYSSIASRGVTAMASRMLSALMPLNDTPFFKFSLKNGAEPTPEIKSYLETLSYQVYNKIIANNLREIVFQALQHLIIVGDVMTIMDDDFNYRNLRIDQYVIQRNVEGKVIELIHLEYLPIDPTDEYGELVGTGNIEYRRGYQTIYCQYLLDEDGKTWYARKENEEGELVMEGEYSILPIIPLRWYGIVGENYGRSHCEDILGDLSSLENYTQSHIEGMAAASTFWMGVDPAGLTELDDIASAGNGTFVPAKSTDVFCLSPAQTLSPQISATSAAVQEMRREVAEAFLMTSGAIPSGDRVTATAVRMIGSELETVLGGAFSAIARDLMEPIVKRAVFVMLNNGDMDERMYEQFFEKDGTLSVEIITGLQALSRDSDLQKLMQMGEMVRNLPPQALQTFRWDAYSKALISSLGFDPRMWVKSEQEIAQEQQMMQQQQMQANMQQQAGNAISSGLVNTASQAAQQDIQQTGGQNIAALAQQMGINPQQIASQLGLQQ